MSLPLCALPIIRSKTFAKIFLLIISEMPFRKFSTFVFYMTAAHVVKTQRLISTENAVHTNRREDPGRYIAGKYGVVDVMFLGFIEIPERTKTPEHTYNQ